ncbi:MAG: hypothetical protein KY476_15710 [Planctomycetes bacterium]|nr:hypothetical protein [Planctomycetota bacterium]
MTEPERKGEQAHEPLSTNVRGVVLFAIGLAVLIAGVLGLMRATSAWLTAAGPPEPGPPQPIYERAGAPPEPRLNPDQAADLKQLKARELRILHEYGWIDRDQKIVRVPVERAAERLAAQGFEALARPAAKDRHAADSQ